MQPKEWIGTLRRRFGTKDSPATSQEVRLMESAELWQQLQDEFPQEFTVASEVTQQVLAKIQGVDFGPLEKNSPGLVGFDWSIYLRCSIVRMVHLLAALRAQGMTTGRVLDYGSYFGNFTLLLRRAGFEVDSIDAYQTYAPSLDSMIEGMKQAGANVYDFADHGYELTSFADGTYDAVICLGVIEHIPHSPKGLLQTLDRMLRPGGVLSLDTPNLAYIYKRQQLARGESVFCPIGLQFDTSIPFEGHHREYTGPELKWMLERIGHTDVRVDAFNYSLYGLERIAGNDLLNFEAMCRDPSAREVLLASSRKAA